MSDWDAFFRLHSDLPREAPGADESTREALRRLPPLPERPRLLDLGCGPGRQTLVLARELTTATIVAVDLHEPYVARLRESAEATGLATRIEACRGRMEAVDELPSPVDLIWSEGAIYLLEFAEGLELWRSLLRAGGFLVVTELTWLVDAPDDEARRFWDEGYPAMTDVAGNLRAARDAGYEIIDHFALPESAWWDDYLGPLEARIETLRTEAARGPSLARVLADHDREIAICRRFGTQFGYVFYLLRA